MRIPLILLIALVFGCSEKKKPMPFIPISTIDPEWSIYEGVVPTRGGDMHIELWLKNGVVGIASPFRLTAHRNIAEVNAMKIDFTSPSSFNTSGPEAWHVIHGYYTLENVNNEFYISLPVSESKYYSGPQKPDEPVRIENLKFKTTDGNWLILIGHDNFKPDGKTHRIPKRMRLFTAEGYFSFTHNAAEFFERNTTETWTIAPHEGFYDVMKQKYYELSTEKFEGVYVRALAYAIKDTDADGNEKESIVFKNILKIGGAPEGIAFK